jgi:hypothetical protein
MKILINTVSDVVSGDPRTILGESGECVISGDSGKVIDDIYEKKPGLLMPDAALSLPSVQKTLSRLKAGGGKRVAAGSSGQTSINEG